MKLLYPKLFKCHFPILLEITISNVTPKTYYEYGLSNHNQ